MYFYEKDGEDQTRDLTVHNITSCRRRHCEEVDKKCYVAILPSKLDFQSQYLVGFLGGMVRDIAPETLYPGTRRVIDTTRTRTGSERSGYYPSGTRVVDKRGTTLVHQCQVPVRGISICCVFHSNATAVAAAVHRMYPAHDSGGLKLFILVGGTIR